LPKTDADTFLEDLKKRLKNPDIEVSTIYKTPVMKSSDPNNEYYRHLQAAILKNYPEAEVLSIILPNTSDAGIFRAKGINTYTTVPISISREYLTNIHSENERIPRGVLNSGKATYVDFIEECIKGAPATIPFSNEGKGISNLSSINTSLE